ncbi:MAG: hypothetical protein ACPLRM_03890 [Anaerolineae bacterium]
MKKRFVFLGRLLLALLPVVIASLAIACSAPEPTPTPQPTATPKPTPTPTPRPIDLVVLHTNDVLGYTEPCG